MNLVHVYVENNTSALDQTYTYQFQDEPVAVGKRVLVNFHHRTCIGFVDAVEMNAERSFPYALKSIVKVLDEEPILNEELISLAKWMSKTTVSTVISALSAMVPSQLKPSSSAKKVKMEAWVRPKADFCSTPKQKAIYQQLAACGTMKKSQWRQLSASITKKLEEMGCVEVYEQEAKENEKVILKRSCPHKLTDEQQQAVDSILHPQKDVIVLKGVTGSGKTEVFLHAAQKVLKQGRQVLFLVPEISLTPLMLKRVQERFGSDVAIYHSSLSPQQKYEQYQSIKKHEKHIVVGTRSAIFMPFDDLGLIILDEEHDLSYKQDNGCRYHARDVALMRAKTHRATVVLASATPSLDTMARALKGVYQLVEIKNRINLKMPSIKLINMNEVIRKKQSYILSDEMIAAMKTALNENRQMILLLNRRGYQPIQRCNDCGSVLMCPHCDKPLVLHKDTQTLNCHLCGYATKKLANCPQCHGKLSGSGFGTQMLAEKVNEVFPEARIIRMDADTTTRKDAHEKLLSQFERHEADILLGTQMIAKGLDFENVTLVGILQGDALLQRSDYRSAELAFDLLMQASGRSGRGENPGRVLIQVYDERHYAVQCALHQNYNAFFKHEMRYRYLAQYPPYTYLCAITFIHKQEELAYEAAVKVMDELKDEPFKILGVSELLKIQDEKRYRICIKSKSLEKLEEAVYAVYQKQRQNKSRVRVHIDMNPLTLED